MARRRLSPDFVRAPDGTGCDERFIRILTENLLRVRTVETLGALRQALLAFQRRYDETWMAERHGHRSSA